MENRNSGNGFLLGMIVGGAIVFLLGTDKGRQILKSLTDEGISEISDILENVQEEEDYEEEPVVKKTTAKTKESVDQESVESPSGNSYIPNKRRFFRRSRS